MGTGFFVVIIKSSLQLATVYTASCFSVSTLDSV